jgi:aarF domain-containing kinase
MPYLSRRLLTDNNPRMRAALRSLLYGDGQRLDIDRLQSLISSFGSFSTSANAAAPSARSGAMVVSPAYEEDRVKGAYSPPRPFGAEEPPVLNETMKEALKVVFAKDGSYAQEVRRK